jgi:polysaccharide export outer membrane protein
VWLGALLCVLDLGCHATPCPPADVPRELAKVSLPPYVIESPDVLQIDAIRLVPKPPYRIEPLDTLVLRVTETLPEQPIAGVYAVEPEGTVTLGFDYGSVVVAGLTVPEARAAIARHLRGSLKPGYQVSVAIGQSRAMQLIRGPHLVRTDGTISLGTYGSVYVDDLTVPQAKEAIEKHLGQFLLNPEISLDVIGFNSKVFYVITDGGGYGQQVTRLPMTGKTTVLDAVGLVNGLGPVSSKHRIWVARPAPSGTCSEQTLAVDWGGITERGETATNYQLLPGDRLFIQSNPLVRIDTYMARLYAPFERVLGITLLGTSVISSIQQIANFGATATSTTAGPAGTTTTTTTTTTAAPTAIR